MQQLFSGLARRMTSLFETITSEVEPDPEEVHRFALLARRGWSSLSGSWRNLTSDFTAHAITYLGVLLSMAVVFVFFAYGHFGEAVTPGYRPLVEIGIPVFFFVIAWILHRRTGIPQTAAAVELIGALSLAIMLSATFRDGSPCCPPDLGGAGRWLAYGAVGAILVAVYYQLARRRPWWYYPYLVVAALWTGIGALGLYLDDALGFVGREGFLGLLSPGGPVFVSDGMSGWQLAAVLIVMAASVGVARRYRQTEVGRRLSIPTVRLALVLGAPVLVAALVFSLSDQALAGGIGLGGQGAVALLAGATIARAIRRSKFAWDGAPLVVTQRLDEALGAATYVLLTAAWAVTSLTWLDRSWFGVGLLGVAALVVALERTGPTRYAGVWTARAAGLLGLGISFFGPATTFVAWGIASITLGLMDARPDGSDALRRYLPLPERFRQRQPIFGIAALASVSGLVTTFDIAAAAWALAAVAIVFTAAGFLPPRFRLTTTLAGIPAAIVVGSSVAVGLNAGLDELTMGLLFLVLTTATALLRFDWWFRLGPVTLGAVVTLALLGHAALGPGESGLALANVIGAGTVGSALIGHSLAHRDGRYAAAHGGLGQLLVTIALLAGLRFDLTLAVALVLVTVTSGAEALFVERRNSPTIEWLVARIGGGRFVRTIPALIAGVALPITIVVIANQVEFFAAERPRIGLLLAAVAWVYVAAAAALRGNDRLRPIATIEAHALAVLGVLVAIPSTGAVTLAMISLAAVAFTLAALLHRPYRSVVGWAAALVSGLLLLDRIGVAAEDLHLGFLAEGLALVVGTVVVARLTRTEARGLVASPWLQTSLVVGLLVVPAGLSFSFIDQRYLVVAAAAAASIYGVVGWWLRSGGFAFPAAISITIAYGSLVAETWTSPIDGPAVWLPLIVALVLGSAVPRSRRSRDFIGAVSPNLTLVALAIATLALVLGVPAGQAGWILLADAGILMLIHAIRREGWAWYGSVAALVAAGLAIGGAWIPLTTTAGAALVGWRGTTKPEARGAVPHVATATFLLMMAYAGLALWLDWSPHVFARFTGGVGLGLAAAAAWGTLRRLLAARLKLWLIPTHVLAQAAAVATITAAGLVSTATFTEAIAFVAAAEAIMWGAIGTVRLNRTLIWTSTLFGVVSYAATVAVVHPTTNTLIAVTAIAAAVIAAAATIVTLTPNLGTRITIWTAPAHTISQLGALTVIAASAATHNPTTTAGIIALVATAEAALTATLAVRPSPWPWRDITAVLVVVAAIATGVAVGPPAGFIYLLDAVAVGAWVAVLVGTRRLGLWLRSTLLISIGLALSASILAIVFFGIGSLPAAATLWTLGALAAATGTVRVRPRAIQAGVLAWLIAAITTVRILSGVDRNVYVLITAVAVLAILEIERWRYLPEPLPTVFQVAEVAAMALLLLTATLDAFADLRYVVVLLTESAGLLVWGILTEVKRRAAVGLLGLSVGVVLSVAIPVSRQLEGGGLTSGTALAIGGVVAVLLILAGSGLEKYRATLGKVIRRLSEILEEWQ